MWLGAALLAAFSVAPAAFAALPTRAEAGSFVGGILRFVYAGGIVASVAALLVTGSRGGSRRNVRLGLAAIVALASAGSFAIAAKIGAMRAALGPIDALPPDDPQRRTFGMLHGVSVLVLFVAMVAALLAIALEGLARIDAPAADRPA